MNSLNPSIKHHLIIGGLISIWTFIFAFVVRPFDDGTLNFRIWLLISIGFSLTVFVSYGLLSIIQKIVYSKISKWNIGLEITSLVFFYSFYFICIYAYYKSPLISGGYNIFEFSTIIFLRAALISAPVIVLARRYLIKLIPIKDEVLTIKGENKLDILKIEQSNLICASSSQNYVEIFFTQNGQLKSKLIRTSLKKIQKDFEFLIQIHRSHLINPAHFISWKDQNMISLTQMELPVSKSYKSRILSL